MSEGVRPAEIVEASCPAFLLLFDDQDGAAGLSRDLDLSGLCVLVAGTAEAALAILREHNERIVCLLTDRVLSAPGTGLPIPFWFRFYNPFGPVIYVTEEPECSFDPVENAVVLSRPCGPRDIVQALRTIRERLESIHSGDMRLVQGLSAFQNLISGAEPC